jgi:hypothetical protein
MSTWDNSGVRKEFSADSLRDCGSADRHADLVVVVSCDIIPGLARV